MGDKAMWIHWRDGSARLDPEDGHGHIATVRMRPTKTDNVREYQEFARRFAATPLLVEALEAFAERLRGSVPYWLEDEYAKAIKALEEAGVSGY